MKLLNQLGRLTCYDLGRLRRMWGCVACFCCLAHPLCAQSTLALALFVSQQQRTVGLIEAAWCVWVCPSVFGGTRPAGLSDYVGGWMDGCAIGGLSESDMDAAPWVCVHVNHYNNRRVDCSGSSINSDQWLCGCWAAGW